MLNEDIICPWKDEEYHNSWSEEENAQAGMIEISNEAAQTVSGGGLKLAAGSRARTVRRFTLKIGGRTRTRSKFDECFDWITSLSAWDKLSHEDKLRAVEYCKIQAGKVH